MREIGDTRSEAVILRNLEELEREAGAAAHRPQAPAAEATTSRGILIQFIEADGPLRAVLYGKYAATLQSQEVAAMLTKMIATARGSGNTALAEYGESIRDFLRRMRDMSR